MMLPLLDIQQLNIRFPGSNAPVVNSISFQIMPGQTLGLVGESGSGKSLTALSLLRLVPAARISGSALWQENSTVTDLFQLPLPEMAGYRGKRISMVFQEPMTALNPVIRCGEQIAESVRGLKGLAPAEARAATLQWLSRVKISDPERVYHAYPHELSGGQKQRVLIAMAMCGQPQLLIADEPTTALDVSIQQSILDLLQDLKTEFNQSMLFISHDLAVVSKVADTVAVMQKGEIVEYGPVRDILEHPTHPYTRGLLACRPSVRRRYRRLPTLHDPTPGEVVTPAEEQEKIFSLLKSEPVLQVRDIGHSFTLGKNWFAPKKRLEVLKGISFNLYPGESFGLVGESGSGKTTLGRCIAQQLFPESGEILYLNKPIGKNGRSDPQYRTAVQMIFQDPYSSLNPRLTAAEAIIEPIKVHQKNTTAAQRRDKAAELLELVGMHAGMLDRLPHAFSGGQRQRICIARALAVQPRVLICDEITSALDISVQATVLNLLLDLQEKLQLSYLFISHDLSVIRQMCDRVLVLRNGLADALDSPAALFDNPPTAYVKTLIEASG